MNEALVLDNGLVITATERDPFHGGVVVERGTVVDLFEGPRHPATDGPVIDLRGRSLLPGLIDAHVHSAAVDADLQYQSLRRFESEVAILAAHALHQMLERGFTTVRDAGGADAGVRRALEQRAVVGPRLLVSGRPITQTGGHGDHRSATAWGADGEGVCGTHVGSMGSIADGPDNVRRAVREELRRGADQIKIMAGGGVMSPTDRLTAEQYTTAELRAAVEAAADAETYVMAHAYTPGAIRRCVEAGVRSIEHGNLLDEETAALMAAHGTFLVPTLVTYERLHQMGSEHGIDAEKLDKLGAIIDAGLKSLQTAKAAGVRIGSGSDLLGPMRRSQGEEIALQADALGALGAIVAATRTNAELLRIDQQVGTIEQGKRADLVVVDGNVLDRPDALGQVETTLLVLKDGEVVVSRLEGIPTGLCCWS